MRKHNMHTRFLFSIVTPGWAGPTVNFWELMWMYFTGQVAGAVPVTQTNNVKSTGVMTNKKAQLSLINPRDAVEIRVMGHSRASKMTPFDSLPMVSYYHPILILCLKRTIWKIWLGRKSPKNLPHSHSARSLGVTPCEFFDESYLARKWNHGAIRWCTFHNPASLC